MEYLQYRYKPEYPNIDITVLETHFKYDVVITEYVMRGEGLHYTEILSELRKQAPEYVDVILQNQLKRSTMVNGA